MSILLTADRFSMTQVQDPSLYTNLQAEDTLIMNAAVHTAVHSLVVIDTAVEDYSTLVDALISDYKVYLLNPQECGITQITRILREQVGITSLHILSHGRPGELLLGDRVLNAETLSEYAAQFQLWRAALQPNAEILLYGCEVAKGDRGRELIQQLSHLTGATLAASTTLTGDAAQGGDWQLQVQTGRLQSAVLTVPHYSAVLSNSSQGAPMNAGDQSSFLILADVNNDGTLDLIVSNTGILGQAEEEGDSVSVLLGNGDGDFSVSSEIVVGSDPVSVVLKDLNGDGSLDLVVANAGSNTVSIHLGDGQGGFTGNTNISVGAKPASIALGDVDGDGNLDLVVANTGLIDKFFHSGVLDEANTEFTDKFFHFAAPDDVTLHLGDGQGSFGNGTRIDVGEVITSVMLADVNNDGTLDLLATDATRGVVSVSLGNELGGFENATVVPVGINPASMALGDLNDDGNLDLVVANAGAIDSQASTLSVRFGNGNGTFSSGYDVIAGRRPTVVELGDLNNDGNLDIFVANTSSDDISVFLLNGQRADTDGSSSTVNTIIGSNTLSTDGDIIAIALGDVNNDDKLDIVAFDEDTNTITALLNGTPRASVAAGFDPVEGDTLGTFSIILDQPAPVDGLAVVFSLAGTASQNSDYQFQNIDDLILENLGNGRFEVVIPEGETSVQIFLNATDDQIIDADETIELTLEQNGGYMLDESFSATLTIADPPNLAPSLVETDVALNDILEDALAPAGAVGTLVSQLVGLMPNKIEFDEKGDIEHLSRETVGPGNVTDADVDAVTGIAVIAADTTHGTWFFSTDNGESWEELGSTSEEEARLLAADATTRLYFQPDADYNGEVSEAIAFRAWDQTAGENGGIADTTTHGGTTAFSDEVETAAIAITAINDAPAFTSLGDIVTQTGGGSSAEVIEDWVQSVDFGALNEADQEVLKFNLEVTEGAELFSVAPSMDANGNLSYTTTGQVGTATLQVTLQDNGGTENGGVDTSEPLTFTITIEDVTAPMVELEAIAPNLRDTPLSSLSFEFSEAVENVNLADLQLTRDGLAVDLTGATLTVEDNTYTLTNLEGVTEANGLYQFTIAISDIEDAAGNSLIAPVTTGWRKDQLGQSMPAIDHYDGFRVGISETGTADADEIMGTTDSDVLFGAQGDDDLLGGNGRDYLAGGQGNDFLWGGRARDYLVGGRGEDTLQGGMANDILVGGRGSDLLTGGAGADMFVAPNALATVDLIVEDPLLNALGLDLGRLSRVVPEPDTITDFTIGEDVLDLRGLFAQDQYQVGSPLEAYRQFVDVVQVGSDTEVRVDEDGSGLSDRFVTLFKLNNITAADFRASNVVIS